jgi:hypothetical protein
MSIASPDLKRKPKSESKSSVTSPLTSDELRKMDAYWRASNYLSVGQIYLLDNPLLKKPLTREQIKPRLLGHWGTTPGLNFVYVHLNRIISAHDLNMIYVAGSIVANTAANTTGVTANFITNWSIEFATTLTAGSHTIEVRAVYNSGSTASVSSGSGSKDQERSAASSTGFMYSQTSALFWLSRNRRVARGQLVGRVERQHEGHECIHFGWRKVLAVSGHVAAALDDLPDELIFREPSGDKGEVRPALAADTVERMAGPALFVLEDERSLQFKRRAALHKLRGRRIAGPRVHVWRPR